MSNSWADFDSSFNTTATGNRRDRPPESVLINEGYDVPETPGRYYSTRRMPKVNAKSHSSDVLALIGEMKRNLRDSAFQESALVSLYKFGTSERNKNHMLDLGVGDAVLDAMKQHENDVRVNTAGCSVIRLTGGNIYRFNQKGAGVAVMTAMYNFKDDARLQASACYAIRTLARCTSNAEFLIQYGVADLISKAMGEHHRDEEVQKAACGAVWCLCGANGSTSKMWKFDLPRHVVYAMRSLPRSLKVQEYGTGALRGFGRPYSTVRLGGADAVLAALRHHMSNARVVEYSLKAIRDFSELRTNVEVFLLRHTPKIIVDCLMLHRKVRGVQEIGCAAIWAMSFWPDSRTMFLKDKVGRVFLHIIEDFSNFQRGSSTMLITVFTILKRFGTTDAAVREFLPLNICAESVRCGRMYLEQNEPKVVCCVLEVLTLFSQTLPEAKQIIYAEAEDLVKSILRRNSYDMTDSFAKMKQLARILADLNI